MLGFMRDGGWPMYPVLLLGVCAMAVALRDTLTSSDVGPAARRLTWAMLGAAIGGSLLDARTVLLQAPNLDSPTLNLGLGESLAPVVLGFALFALGQVVLALAPARRMKA